MNFIFSYYSFTTKRITTLIKYNEQFCIILFLIIKFEICKYEIFKNARYFKYFIKRTSCINFCIDHCRITYHLYILKSICDKFIYLATPLFSLISLTCWYTSGTISLSHDQFHPQAQKLIVD